jgi:transcriptional regulator with XRE-family HTH domain
MKSLGCTLRSARTEKNLVLRSVAGALDIDQSLISKFEKNERKPTSSQITRLAEFYGLQESELMIQWYSEKIADELKYSESSTEILKIAEEKIQYYKAQESGK